MVYCGLNNVKNNVESKRKNNAVIFKLSKHESIVPYPLTNLWQRKRSEHFYQSTDSQLRRLHIFHLDCISGRFKKLLI